ncbi:uncharacterized protein LOC135133272 isoform X2 [Zophobas morio]|uniref:uncharacterized protein LOC135133272 isoform X2 n=1 Tax=Zophobas morio TaxID=2755281 RepID=UPI003083ADC1
MSAYKMKTVRNKLIVEKFFSLKIDDNLKNTLLDLWKDKKEAKYTLCVFAEWLVATVDAWTTSSVTPEATTTSFTLRLSAILCTNEERFAQLNNNNFFAKLIRVTKVRESGAASVKIAYVKLLSAFLEHEAGVEWMVACNFWEDVLELCVTGSGGIVKESVSCVGKLLEKAVGHDESFCDGVIKKIMLPLGENIYRCVKASSDVSDDAATELLRTSLKVIGDVLEFLLRGVCLEGKDFEVLFLFLKNFHLEERICDFMIVAQNKRLLFDLSKIMFVMQFLELYGNVITNSITMTKVKASVDKIRNNFTTNMFKGSFSEQLQFCPFGFLFWKLMEAKFPICKIYKSTKGTFHFTTQLFGFFVMPICTFFVKKYLLKKTVFEEEISNDDFRNDYDMKIQSIVSFDLIRAFYFWNNRNRSDPNLQAFCEQAISTSKNCIIYFSREEGITYFQTLVYHLVDIVRTTKDSTEKIDILVKDFLYCPQIFELVGMLIEKFQISLKDCIETTYVISVCFDFLALTEWSSKVVVEVIKLINIAIAHYLAPNMALLVEDAPDPTVNLLGPLLFSKLLDKNPKVNVATLEVIYTVTTISKKKFPSLQKVLMDSELPTLVVKMSTCDGESFVRATAIKCLQEMIQVEEIWNNALKTEDLSQKMRDILLNETEGIVRVEAATFMCVAYEHQQFPKDSLDAIYETMIYSSTTDLHWEVKVRALNFWDKVIKNHLQNQGMIDGSFPNVTFSKEHRKIVTLTDSEIRKRLLKVLGQLSAIGCLGVLTAAIKDDCDMEVSKTAVKITQKLVDLLKKYAVGGECSGPTSPIPTESGMSMSSGISVDESMDSPRSSQPDLNEEIIEQIVNAKDASLLKGVYAPSDYGSVSNYDFQVRKIVTPTEFLQFTHQDLNNIIAEKKKWLNGIEDLGSLLDDMLKTYDEDVNSMDCY